MRWFARILLIFLFMLGNRLPIDRKSPAVYLPQNSPLLIVFALPGLPFLWAEGTGNEALLRDSTRVVERVNTLKQ